MFQDFIIHVNNGATLAELSEELKKVVAAVRQTGKAGTLTLAINVMAGPCPARLASCETADCGGRKCRGIVPLLVLLGHKRLINKDFGWQ